MLDFTTEATARSPGGQQTKNRAQARFDDVITLCAHLALETAFRELPASALVQLR